MHEIDSVIRSGTAHGIAEVAGRIRGNHATYSSVSVPEKSNHSIDTKPVRPAVSENVRSLLLSNTQTQGSLQTNINLIRDLLSTIRQYESRIS